MSTTTSASGTRPRDLRIVPPCGRALASYQHRGRRVNDLLASPAAPRSPPSFLRRRFGGRSVQCVPRAFVVRRYRSSDLDGALAANDAVGWTGRRVLFDYYAARDDCALFVAEVDGEIVGTGGATIFTGAPPTGWVHGIVVRPRRQRSGLGRSLTEAAIAWLRGRSAGAVLLLATEAGRPVDERLGFGAGQSDGAVDCEEISRGSAAPGAGTGTRRTLRRDLHTAQA